MLERINPGDVYPPIRNAYTQVIRATGSTQIHVAGLVSFDGQQNFAGEGDMRTQIRVTLENLRRCLAAAGATPADVVRINIFTTDMDAYRAVGYVEMQEFFGETRPVSTLVGVTRLADPRYLVEIQATAILD